MSTDNIKPSDLLRPMTPEYMPSAGSNMYYSTRNRPPFTRSFVREMLTDPRITYGLYLIKGPIVSNAKFAVESDASEVKEYVQSSVERFWRNSASRALKAIEWGYSGSEVMYRKKNERIHFDVLKDLDPADVSPVRCKGKLVGLFVQNNRSDLARTRQSSAFQNRVYLGGPKAFWHVHWRERSPWWGVSRLFGAHIPYWEKWSEGGFRDIRRLWFHKNAFEGGTMYHPPGSTYDTNGVPQSNKDLAREMLEKKRTGGTLTLPNTPGGDGGQRAWEYMPPVGNATPEGLLEYGQDLDSEILEALGIPPEVIESGGETGFGSSTGRQVPQEAFYAILDELIGWLCMDFDAQVLRPLVELNFGEGIEYEIYPIPLGENPMEDPQMEGESTGENQFLEEDGDAKDQDQIDQEEADRYEKARSGAVKGGEAPPTNKPKPNVKKTFSMSQGEMGTSRKSSVPISYNSPSTPASLEGKGGSGRAFMMKDEGGQSQGQWITIGGRPSGGKKHVGGFPVQVSQDGTILAGGPRALHGTNISESHKFFNKDRKEEAKKESSIRTPEHTKHGLPDPNSSLGLALKQYAGDDPATQAYFHNLVKETHAEHQQKVAAFKNKVAAPDYNKKFYKGADLSKAEDYAKRNGFEYTPEVRKLLEDNVGKIKDGNRDLDRLFKSAANFKNKDYAGQASTSDEEYVEKVLKKRNIRDQERSWASVSKNLADTVGMDKDEVDKVANDLYDRMKGEVKAREDIKAAIRKTFKTNSLKEEKAEDRNVVDKFDHYAMSNLIGSFDQNHLAAAGFQVSDYNSLEGATHNAEVAADLVKEGKQRVPGKIDDDFLVALYSELTGGGDEEGGDDAVLREMDDNVILDRALQKWHLAASEF